LQELRREGAVHRLYIRILLFTGMVTTVILLAACAGRTSSARPSGASGTVAGSPQAGSANTEQAVAPEKNPAGDIPDTQAFVSFTPPSGGYTVDAPEGWARTVSGSDVRFVDKLNGETVTLVPFAAAPTAATARTDLIPALVQGGHAVQVTGVQDVQLPGGAAVHITYTSNSDPNAVTGKQVRLENEAYLFFNGGKLATLTVSAPQGADNVDQWQRIARSFRWS
jgi:hypothetical protein